MSTPPLSNGYHVALASIPSTVPKPAPVSVKALPLTVKTALPKAISATPAPRKREITVLEQLEKKIPATLLSLLYGQSKEAKEILTGLLLEHTTDQTVSSFLGSILAFGKNNILAKPIQAVTLLEQALQIDPHDIEALASLGALLAFGAKEVKSDPARAEILLTNAISNDPNNARALTFLGSLLSSGAPEVTEDLERATHYLERAIALQDAPAHFAASMHSLFSPGNIRDYAKALAYMGAIEAFFLGENLVDKEAITIRFLKATRYDPNDPLYQAWRGLYQEHLGENGAENKVWDFFINCSSATTVNQQMMKIFLHSIRINWAQALLKKYTSDVGASSPSA